MIFPSGVVRKMPSPAFSNMPRYLDSISWRFVTSTMTPARFHSFGPAGLMTTSREVPFIRACWPDDNLLAEPVNAVGPDDRKLLLVSVRSLGEGSPGSLIHPLVLGRLFVVPEPVLLDQGSQLEYGISAEMRRSLDLPIVCRALARHPGPPKKNVGLLERIQDQLIVLEHGGGGAVPICGCARPPPREKVNQADRKKTGNAGRDECNAWDGKSCKRHRENGVLFGDRPK